MLGSQASGPNQGGNYQDHSRKTSPRRKKATTRPKRRPERNVNNDSPSFGDPHDYRPSPALSSHQQDKVDDRVNDYDCSQISAIETPHKVYHLQHLPSQQALRSTKLRESHSNVDLQQAARGQSHDPSGIDAAEKRSLNAFSSGINMEERKQSHFISATDSQGQPPIHANDAHEYLNSERNYKLLSSIKSLKAKRPKREHYNHSTNTNILVSSNNYEVLPKKQQTPKQPGSKRR